MGGEAVRGEPARCIVVGASVRAFAESAARGGWSVHAADLFGDVDLRAAATEVVRVGAGADAAYPRGLPGVVERFPPAPVAYTGALENHPDVIEALARERPLAGCAAAAVRSVRDPRDLAAVVHDAGLRFPETVASPAGLPTDGTFLVKRRASAGGRGITAWRGDAAAAARDDVHWQRFVPGEPWSAAWIARGGGATLVGASQPLRGGPWCGAGPFAYCGSVDAPLTQLPDRLRRAFESLGNGLARAFDLVGAFGSDVIVDESGIVHVLEVNPRPTASMELVERSTGWSLASAHLAACGMAAAPAAMSPGDGVWAKAIVHAPRRPRPGLVERILDVAEPWTLHDGRAAVADVPPSGFPIVGGAPLVTAFARRPTRAAAAAELRARVRRLRRLAAGDVSLRGDDRPRPRLRRGRTA
jgi:predicted ATP-grasp superfamily ATP-dependent carboligase